MQTHSFTKQPTPAFSVLTTAFGFLVASLAILLASFMPTFAAAQELPQTTLPRVSITVGAKSINVQKASTQEEVSKGLMWRVSMAENDGMLFVFPAEGSLCFWMKNTLLPLSAAFVANDGTIINIVDMQPQSEEPHCALQPARFVLEMNQGWFEKNNVAAGDMLK